MKAAARGFTMIELVLVIVLVGILGAVATARYVDNARFDAAAYAEQTRTMLRYGQKVAVAQHRPVFVVFSNKRIALCFDAACSNANRLLAPGGANSGSRATAANCAAATWYCEGTPDSLAYALQGANAGNFFFDALGQPFAVTVGTPALAALVVRITGDGLNRDVTVSPETGYVY
jgi:MSHA pilin protein MshC